MAPAAFLLGLLLQADPPEGKSVGDLTTDPTDGAFDVSEYLLSRGAFLPVPIVVTEPALGYGGGLAAVFFHEPPFGDPDEEREGDAPLQLVPRSVTFAAGAGTFEGSYFVGGGHFQAWDDGDWRVLGVAGYAHAELDYYGEGTDVDLQDDPVEYALTSRIVMLDLQRRLHGPFFASLRYQFMATDVEFEDGLLPPGVGIPAADFSLNSGGLGLGLTFDTRDNVMTPSRGLRVEARPWIFDEALGGDTRFTKLELKATTYVPLEPFLWSTKVEAGWASGDAPFYQLPFVVLRGVPLLRYLGTDVLAAETELELALDGRWSVLAFGGVGRAELHSDRLDTGGSVYAGGAGFRYLIARRFGMKAGLDFAVSTDDHALYIVLGTAWY